MSVGLREASGSVDDNDPLVSVLYSLLRDHVHPGDLEALVLEEEHRAPGDGVTRYTNGWIARYAQNLARRIRRCDNSVRRKQSTTRGKSQCP